MGRRRTKLAVALSGLLLAAGIIVASAAGLTTACDGDGDGNVCAAACQHFADLCMVGSPSSSSSGGFVGECTASCAQGFMSSGSGSSGGGSQRYVVDCVLNATSCWAAEYCGSL